MHTAGVVSCLLVLQLVFCTVITLGIRTVVGRSKYIPQWNLWSWSGKGFLSASFVWRPCPSPSGKPLNLSSPLWSLPVTIPLSSPSRDITVYVCHQRVNLAFLCASFVPCNLVHGSFFALTTLCYNDLFTRESPHQTDLAKGRNRVSFLAVSLVPGPIPGMQLGEWRSNLSC